MDTDRNGALQFFWRQIPIVLSVEKPYTEVQISGKGDPNKIRNLQPCCKFIDFAERQNHQQNQNPQKHQPYERKTTGLKIEENDTPEKVEYQLDQEQKNTTRACAGGG